MMLDFVHSCRTLLWIRHVSTDICRTSFGVPLYEWETTGTKNYWCKLKRWQPISVYPLPQCMRFLLWKQILKILLASSVRHEQAEIALHITSVVLYICIHIYIWDFQRLWLAMSFFLMQSCIFVSVAVAPRKSVWIPSLLGKVCYR